MQHRGVQSLHVALLAVIVALAGCRHQRERVEGVSSPGDGDFAGLPRCRVAPSPARPFVVEWSGTDRGALELALRRGPVVARYDGCELTLLRQCRAPGAYVYAGFTRKHDTVVIRDVDQLYAQMPLGAVELEATLARTGELHVEMTLVGMLEGGHGLGRADLEGTCDGATHVISGAHVGAFTLHAGAQTDLVAAVGPQRSASRELINADGTPAACETADPSDVAPPEGCAAVVRIELTPLRSSPTPSAVPAPTAPRSPRRRHPHRSSPSRRPHRRPNCPRPPWRPPSPSRRRPVCSPLPRHRRRGATRVCWRAVAGSSARAGSCSPSASLASR